jgi:hypothetical protein
VHRRPKPEREPPLPWTDLLTGKRGIYFG